MVEQDIHRHLEVTDGDRVVTSAEIHTPADTGERVRAALRAEAGHIRPGSRADLVDAVLDLPEVQDIGRLVVTVPLGDAESLQRLQHRCEDMTTRAAGSSALVQADLPWRAPQPNNH
jgi:hypothetical protein